MTSIPSLDHWVLNMGALPLCIHRSTRTQEEREMRNFGESWIWLPCMVAVSVISAQAVHAQPPSPASKISPKVGNVPVANVLERAGGVQDDRFPRVSQTSSQNRQPFAARAQPAQHARGGEADIGARIVEHAPEFLRGGCRLGTEGFKAKGKVVHTFQQDGITVENIPTWTSGGYQACRSVTNTVLFIRWLIFWKDWLKAVLLARLFEMRWKRKKCAMPCSRAQKVAAG